MDTPVQTQNGMSSPAVQEEQSRLLAYLQALTQMEGESTADLAKDLLHALAPTLAQPSR